MKNVTLYAALALVCGLGMWQAEGAEARGCFKKLFDRGGSHCCSPCHSYCGEVASCGGCQQASYDCGCGQPASNDCGCGQPASTTGQDGSSSEPTEASPADEMPPVPEPPAAEDAGDATEAAADASA